MSSFTTTSPLSVAIELRFEHVPVVPSMARKSAEDAQEFEALRVHAAFRRTMMVMTLVWGFGLLVHFAVSVALVFALSIRMYLIVAPIVGYGTMGLLTLWTFLYARRARRRGEEARAARMQDAAGAEAA